MIRILCMAGGIASAIGFSQFPEYSQQYLQRLSGAVDELRAIVVAFDRTAAAAGLTREEALADLDGSAFQSDLQASLAGQIARYETLSGTYAALRRAEPLQRLAQVYRFNDPELARRTWHDFRPAVPASTDGLIFAGIGFLAGWAVFGLIFALFRRAVGLAWRSRRPVPLPDPPEPRVEPQLRRTGPPPLPGARRPAGNPRR